MKAHIVPEAFYRDVRAKSETVLWVAGTNPKERLRRTQIGEYDQELVCEDCERLFQPYDQYAADLLIRDRDTAFSRHYVAGGASYFISNTTDYRLLKLFLISVLWRASASKRRFFDRVSLGKYERVAADLVIAGDPGIPTQFDAILSRWTVAPGMRLPAKFMANPFSGRPYGGVRTARIYLSSFVVDISIERRPLPPPLDMGAIRPGTALTVSGRDLHSSSDLNAFAKTLSETKPPYR